MRRKEWVGGYDLISNRTLDGRFYFRFRTWGETVLNQHLIIVCVPKTFDKMKRRIEHLLFFEHLDL